ncbi:unnamed protein product [Sphagnum compactum]
MEAAAPGVDVELMCKTLQVDHKLFTLTLRRIPVVTTLRFLRRHQGQGPPSLCPWQELCGLLISLITMQMVRIHSFSARSYSSIPVVPAVSFVQIFYFDASENQRGCFLKVSEASMSCSRSTIIIPAGNASNDGWEAFRNFLVEIHEASQHLLPPPDDLEPSQLATGHAEHMDLGDAIGAGFMPSSSPPVMSPISSVAADMEFPNVASSATAEDRSAIILPALALEKFHETLGQFVDMVKSQGLVGSSEANVHTIAPQ